MNYLDLTFPTPAENLACDEALAERCERGDGGVLRFWEPQTAFVVLGYANHLRADVNQPACQADALPIYRRVSGGGTVLQIPGCLNYALIMQITDHRPLATVTGANRFIMEKNAFAISLALGQQVSVGGYTDLVIGERKFSGNAQRRYKNCLLFHGCLLLNADLSLMSRYLNLPSKQPGYRRNRAHEDFLANLPLTPAAVKAALRQTWEADVELSRPPYDRIKTLVAQKYARPEWNERFR